jgi:hypothetical protein
LPANQALRCVCCTALSFFAGKSDRRTAGSYGGVHPQNQVGFKAASLSRLILIWLLIFLPHREASFRFCAVGKPAWMPV